MYRILSHSFSTLRVPKDPSLFQDSASSLTKILYELLGKPRRPPCHILSFEAMLHIESPEMLKSKLQSVFPSIHEDYIIHRNLTLMHLSMIAQRFRYEETRESEKEYNRLFELCDSYIFERYLDLVEDLVDVPVAEFEAELVEMISQKFKELHNSIACYGYKQAYIVLDPIPNYSIRGVLLNEVLEYRVPTSDPQVERLFKYFDNCVRFM